MIQTLYVVEKRIRDKPVEERFQIRQSESRPIMEKLKQWMDRQQPKIPPQSLLGKALTYAQNQWKYLVRYLDSGLLDIDNNAAERGIKPFVIGRKNWLFAQIVNGAKASAVLYSLVETAKANGLEPYAWFRYVLARKMGSEKWGQKNGVKNGVRSFIVDCPCRLVIRSED